MSNLNASEDHGTNCAGEIAMIKDNNICGVGVAYQSTITGSVNSYKPLQYGNPFNIRSCNTDQCHSSFQVPLGSCACVNSGYLLQFFWELL